jgi:hypothetical protein
MFSNPLNTGIVAMLVAAVVTALLGWQDRKKLRGYIAVEMKE